jgi:phosphoribosylglycinamide formyltransferase
MESLTPLTILISGNGTNLQAVIDKIEAQQLPATIVRVISNRKAAYGLERAKRAGISTLYHNLLKYKKHHPSTEQGMQAAREEYDRDLAQMVLQDRPALVICLGFLHVLTRSFLDPMEKAQVKIINLHPALPGAFSGSVSISISPNASFESRRSADIHTKSMV